MNIAKSSFNPLLTTLSLLALTIAPACGDSDSAADTAADSASEDDSETGAEDTDSSDSSDSSDSGDSDSSDSGDGDSSDSGDGDSGDGDAGTGDGDGDAGTGDGDGDAGTGDGDGDAGTGDGDGDAGTGDGDAGTGDGDGDAGTGDGDGDAGTGDGDGDAGTGDGDGDVVPSILSVSPAPGETGVRDDASIVITFSEPMDKAATQAAYQSVDLPAAGVTFSWNAAGDEMTVTPNALLDYATGTNPDTVDAIAFEWSLTTVAESEQGMAIADMYDSSFSTLRAIKQTVHERTNLSICVRDLGGSVDSVIGTYRLGDYSTGDSTRCFFTFDLNNLAPEVEEVTSATLVAEIDSVFGNPWSNMGGVVWQRVQFEDESDSIYDTPVFGTGGGVFGTAANTSVEQDVQSQLEDTIANDTDYEGLMQMRMKWLISDSDGDGVEDGVNIDDGLRIVVDYLAH